MLSSHKQTLHTEVCITKWSELSQNTWLAWPFKGRRTWIMHDLTLYLGVEWFTLYTLTLPFQLCLIGALLRCVCPHMQTNTHLHEDLRKKKSSFKDTEFFFSFWIYTCSLYSVSSAEFTDWPLAHYNQKLIETNYGWAMGGQKGTAVVMVTRRGNCRTKNK